MSLVTQPELVLAQGIDWRTPITIDFETYYDKEWTLKKITTEKYIRGEKFECIGLSIKIGGMTTHFHRRENWIGFIKAIIEKYPNSPFVCHNASFDMGILGLRYGIHPRFTVDTSVMAKLCGLDRVAGGSSLAKLTEFLCSKGILTTVKGTEVHNMQGVHADDMTEQQWKDYAEYCKLDTDLCYQLYMYMLNLVPLSELVMSHITTEMWTKPVVQIDVPLLESYADRLAAEREQMLKGIAGKLGLNTDEMLKHLRSAPKFKVILESLGVKVPMKHSEAQNKLIPALSKTDQEFLALQEHPNKLVSTLVSTKLGAMSSMEQTRTATFLDIAQRGLMPIPLRYAAAHTGRYGGSDKVNLQNLSKRTKEPVLRQSLCVVHNHAWVAADSSQIECRVLSYLAKQDDVVDIFKSGKDVYLDMASKIYGESYESLYEQAKGENATKEGKLKRNIGKVVVLGAGYGAGAAKFADLMVQSGLADQADQAERLIATYRSANYMVKHFWGVCQQALETMAQGGTMRFGGGDDNLFEASGATKFHGVTIPSIKLPNGTYIFYQNLRQEVDDKGKLNYVYDQWKGRGFEPKRIWGSALAENLCIAEDTLVLTDTGWKKIQDITTLDKVHDGIDFVTHGGLVFKSVKDCVKVDGVYMTKDHEVLTNDGWKTAEIHLSAGATSQLSRFDFSEVWQANSSQSDSFRWKEVVLGLPMRLWKHRKQNGVQGKGASKQGGDTPLWLQYLRDCIKQSKFSWLHRPPYILDMAEYESSLPKPKTQGMEKLWWQGDNCLRAMVRFPSVLSRYVADLSARFGFRPQGQQSWVLQGELSMGYSSGELQQQTQQRPYPRRERELDNKTVLREVQSENFDSSVSTIEWDNHATTCGTTRHQKAVYDILNCGERNRFVVKGDTAPFVVHNCQALSFAILKWQAMCIQADGYQINLNIHDEWAGVYSKDNLKGAVLSFHCHMSRVPPFLPKADGLLECEVDVGTNYAEFTTIPNSAFEDMIND